MFLLKIPKPVQQSTIYKGKKMNAKKKKNTCELEVTDRIIEQHMTELQTGNKKIVISVYRSLPPPQASYHQGWNHVD